MNPSNTTSNDRSKLKICLLVARFNSLITEQLLDGAQAALRAEGVSESQTTVRYVPGAWELPQASRRVAKTSDVDAIVTMGCVIRGDTAHFDFVAGEACYGLGAVAREISIPLIFGVLTTENAAQAVERASPAAGDKGGEFARSALEMIDLYSALEEAHK